MESTLKFPELVQTVTPQPGHLFVGRRNEYQPEDGDALLLGSKGRYGARHDSSKTLALYKSFTYLLTCWWQVKLCDSVVTHGPYLSALR